MSAQGNFKPKMVGFLCNWCCYGGADLCGVSRFQYPPYLRVVRIMCSGRVDLKFILRAFSNGADAVFIGGCHLNDCHYNPEGNYDALMLSKIATRLMGHIGIDQRRLRLEWVSAGEGIRFAEIMNDFSKTVKELGPLGSSENISKEELDFNIKAAGDLVPFIKLWERERLRVPVRSEQGINQFFNTGVVDDLFDNTIVPKYALSRIMRLLKESPLSTADISGRLRLNPSDVSKYMMISSRHGMVKYNTEEQCYMTA